jgi:hypothetical protein
MMPSWAKFPMIVFITTIVWISVTLLTKQEDKKVLQDFYLRIQPGGPGWKKVIDSAKMENIDIVTSNGAWSVPSGIIAMLLGCVLIYSCLFATGYWIYADFSSAIILTITAIISGVMLIRVWKKIKSNIL